MPFCNNCGTELNDGVKFCSNCGAQVDAQPLEKKSRQTFYEGEIHKCPSCGHELKSFEAICPRCNFELRGVSTNKSIKDFIEKLNKTIIENDKIRFIKLYPIPNTKEDIFEFMLLASSNFDAEFHATHQSVEDISDAWLSMVEQCFQKAKLVIRNDDDFEKIKSMHDEIVERSEKQKNTYNVSEEKKRKKELRNQRWIQLVDGVRYLLSQLVFWIVFGAFTLATALGFIIYFSIDPNKIKIGATDEELCSMPRNEIVQTLTDKGFTDVQLIETDWEPGYETGEIKSINIQGRTNFRRFNRFEKDCKIVIEYNASPKSVTIGISAEDAKGKNYQEVINLLENKGFGVFIIEINKANILPSRSGNIKSISVDGNENFVATDVFMQNVVIVITYHK